MDYAVEMASGLPYTLRSAHIFVRDLPAARRFYVDVLGMPLEFESEEYLGLNTGTCGVMVFQVDDKTPGETFTCLHFGVRDIAGLYERLEAAGVKFRGEPMLHEWGGIMVDFEDPDENVLHLVQYPEG